MNLDDLLKSIREEDDSKGAKIDTEKFLKRKTFTNPLKGQRYQAPGLPSAPPIVFKPTVVNIDPEKLIPENGDVVSEELGDKLDELIKVIREDNKLEEERQKEDDKQLEAKKKKDREDRLESKKETKSFVLDLKKSTGKVGGFFDKLKKFIKLSLLSGLINTLYNFFTDPKNKEKIEAVQGFLRDWWPALAAAIGFVLVPFKGLILNTIGFLTSTTAKILKLFATNPIFAIAVAAGVAGVMDYLKGKNRKLKLQTEVEELMESEGISETEARKRLIKQKEEEARNMPYSLNPFDDTRREILKEAEQLKNIDFERTRYEGFPISQPVNRAPGFEGGGFAMGSDIIPAMLTPGEFIMSRGAVNMFGADTMMAMNKMGGGTNRPKLGKVMGYQGGGMVDKEGPKITDRDYNALLAITSLEDSDPQGRADVAQSIYNRLYSASNFGTNYYQHERGGNDLFSIITARADKGSGGGGQFEPTFGNPQDWFNITDRNSAAVAIVNSKKGRAAEYTMQDAMKMLADTEKALSNSKLQEEARLKVGGRTFFYGTSQQQYMREDLGDVIRNKENDNFFSMNLEEGSAYDMERRNIGADLPQRLQPISQESIKPSVSTAPGSLGPAFSDDASMKKLSKQQLITDRLNSIKSKLSDPIDTFIRTPLRRAFPGTPNVPTETKNFVLPPIESPKQNQSKNQKGNIPSFSVVSSNKMRDLITKDLGIGDLAGVS